MDRDATPPPAAAFPCRNCAQPVDSRFCGHCGQEVEERRGPLLPLVTELISEWLAVDGKLLRSAAALTRPGRLTRLYLDGKRASYLRPLRLYAIASLVLFSSVLDLRAPDVTKTDLAVAGELVTEGTPGERRMSFTVLDPDKLLDGWYIRRSPETVERLRARPPQELLDGLFAGLRRTLPAALILFVPFLALALKVLYFRTRILYVDHLVFAMHVQSALFFGLALAWIGCRVFAVGTLGRFVVYAAVAILLLLVYLAIGLRRVYGQSRWRTAAKTALLFFAYAQLLELAVGVAAISVVSRL